MAKPISKCRRINPDFGKTELKMPPKPGFRKTDLNLNKMPPQARFPKKRSQNAAQTPFWQNIDLNSKKSLNSDCRKTKLKMPPEPEFRKTDLKMPPQARIRQTRTQNAAETPTSANPDPKCRLNPDFGQIDLKMPRRQSWLRQNRNQKTAALSPTSAKPNS